MIEGARPRVVIVWLIAALVVVGLTPANAQGDEPPTLRGFEWLERDGTEQGETSLRLTLEIDAPAGLAGGHAVVWAQSFASKVNTVDYANVPAVDAGSHLVTIEEVPESAPEQPRELREVLLIGKDGRERRYDLCALVAMGDNHEADAEDRVDVHCLPEGTGWALFYLEATGEDAHAGTYLSAVSHGQGEGYGAGFIARTLTVEPYMVMVGRMGARYGRELQVQAAGQVIVDEQEPADHPGERRSFGYGLLEIPLEQGVSYPFAAYFGAKPEEFSMAQLFVIGRDVQVTSVETGTTAGALDTSDFSWNVHVREPDAVVPFTAQAHGMASITVEHSLSYYWGWFGFSSDSIAAGYHFMEGPEGLIFNGGWPNRPNYVYQPPGEYTFHAGGANTGAHADWVVGYADMPVPPFPRRETSGPGDAQRADH